MSFSVALKNIHDLLEPSGQAILILIANNKIFEMYENVAAMPRWKAYMTDWQNFISPYQRASDPVRQFCHLATEAELEVRGVTAPWSTFEYSSLTEIESALAAVSPFTTRIPHCDKGDFMQDCVNEVIRLVGVDGKGVVTSKYQLIVAHLARKDRQNRAQVTSNFAHDTASGLQGQM